jgi:hypothetical protein
MATMKEEEGLDDEEVEEVDVVVVVVVVMLSFVCVCVCGGWDCVCCNLILR